MTHHHIAVLPFVNLSASADYEYFSDGITEEIIHALAQIDGLKVTSRISSFYFKNKQVPLAEIARQLGVSVIVQGSVRIAADQVRISAQLIHAEEDTHFWSESWDRQLDPIFAIQDEVSLLIADRLREHLGHLEFDDQLIDWQTDNQKAYTALLKGRFLLNQWNPDRVKEAIGLFEQVLIDDPEYMDALLGLADAWSFLSTTAFIDPQKGWMRSMEYTQKAFQLDQHHAGVHYQLANLSFFTDCSYSDAFDYTVKALESDPAHPEALRYMAFLYILSGEMMKAQHYLQQALSHDPLNPETLFYKGYFYYRRDDYVQASLIFQDLLELNPLNIPALTVLAYCRLLQKDYDRVLNDLDQMPESVKIPHEILGIKTLAYLMKGDKKLGKQFFDTLYDQATTTQSPQAHSYLLLAYSQLNRFDEAFKWLDKALEMKSSVILLTYSDPLNSPLMRDPRYADYHEKIFGTRHYQIESKPKKALLDDRTTREYAQRILDYVNEQKPYLDPAISLRELAQQVDIHPNQLSWLLNEHLGKKYNEFINTYRLQHFVELAKDPKNAHLSIIGLAYDSGFNSKTVFNTFFKKEMGTTPMEYLKSAQ